MKTILTGMLVIFAQIVTAEASIEERLAKIESDVDLLKTQLAQPLNKLPLNTEDLYCTKVKPKKKTHYLKRYRDNKVVGRSEFTDYETCKMARRTSRRGLVCAIFFGDYYLTFVNGKFINSWYGSHFDSLQECLNKLETIK